jgi:hypothetical protein
VWVLKEQCISTDIIHLDNRSKFCSTICYVTVHCACFICVCVYVCETWSVTLREDHRLRLFKNLVLRETFVPKTGSNRHLCCSGMLCSVDWWLVTDVLGLRLSQNVRN